MENNFEQNIRDHMNNPPELPFEERLWQDMESRLDQQDTPKSYLKYIGKLPLFLLILLLTALSGFFYTNQYKAMNKIAELERIIQEQQMPTVESGLEKHITVIYDTIYRKIEIDQNIASVHPATENSGKNFRLYRNRFSEVVFFAENEGFTRSIVFENPVTLLGSKFASGGSYPGLGLMAKDQLKSGIDENNTQNLSVSPGSISSDDKITSMDFSQPFAEIAPIDYAFLESKPHPELPLIAVQTSRKRKKLIYYLHQLKPTRYMLSGTTGTFVSLNFGGSGFNLRSSAHFEIGIKDRLIWTTGIEYFSNDFNRTIKPDAEEPLEGFPDLPPNNAEDVLTEIQGDFNYLQVPFGLKYIVFPQRYFYPFVGFGLIAGKTTRSRLEYRYDSPLGEYAVSKGELLPNTFDLNAFWSSLGFQVQLNRNWSLVMEGGAQFDLQEGNYKYEDLRILKLSTGFQYKF